MPSILSLKLLEPLDLVSLEALVLLPPTMESLLGHADLFTYLGRRPTLGDQHSRLTQLFDDLQATLFPESSLTQPPIQATSPACVRFLRIHSLSVAFCLGLITPRLCRGGCG